MSNAILNRMIAATSVAAGEGEPGAAVRMAITGHDRFDGLQQERWTLV